MINKYMWISIDRYLLSNTVSKVITSSESKLIVVLKELMAKETDSDMEEITEAVQEALHSGKLISRGNQLTWDMEEESLILIKL